MSLSSQENKDVSRLNLSYIFRAYWPTISVTWLLTLTETALTALIPLLIGLAIDGLLAREHQAFLQLLAVLTLLIIVGVGRRIYDTRAYGEIKAKLSALLLSRSEQLPVSTKSARMDMARELIDFLEHEVPELMSSIVQVIIAVIILYSFHPSLSYSALLAAVGTVGIYALFHRRFFNLNGHFNQLKENQVKTIETSRKHRISDFLDRLKRAEIKLSDTEALVYGAIFILLMSFIAFNLWYATTGIESSPGSIFAIVSYSWEFVEAILILPITLQSWSRLSEITQRINSDQHT